MSVQTCPYKFGRLAQLVRALHSHCRGHRFESCVVHTKNMSEKFIKNIEDFTCAHCGAEVKGTGYTNHCPECLYSLHVDVNPGDRASACGGLMAPIAFEGTSDALAIIHCCEKCGYKKRNKMSPDDNLDTMVNLINKQLKK